jgi:Holliday junction DNA helicase RuvA
MFDYIKGKLAYLIDSEAVIDNHGLGYRLLISQKTKSKLPQIHEEVTFFISAVIREDSHRLFAFLTRQDRDFFETLIEFSGIGPKTALGILGQFEPYELIELAACSDVQKISKVPGIGKKTAERLIVELKGKNLKIAPPEGAVLPKNSSAQDALAALLQLGFAYPLAQKAIGSVIEDQGDTISLSELISASLQRVRK